MSAEARVEVARREVLDAIEEALMDEVAPLRWDRTVRELAALTMLRYLLAHPDALLTVLGASDGAARIAAERRRQVEQEGWTPEHDDAHDACELTQAAIAYAWHAVRAAHGVEWPEKVPSLWPFGEDCWKRSDDPIRNLEKAGALIAAEIDRLLRRTQGDADG